jgi:hypothetical protein
MPEVVRICSDVFAGQPAHEINIVDRQVDDDADLRHAWRERSDPGDVHRDEALGCERLLEGDGGRIEALHVPDHEHRAGRLGGIDDGPGAADIAGDGFFHQHRAPGLDAPQRHFCVEVGRHGDADGLHPGFQEGVERSEGAAAGPVGDGVAFGPVGVDDPDQRRVGQFGEDAGMGLPDHSRPHDAHSQRQSFLHARFSSQITNLAAGRVAFRLPMLMRPPVQALSP